MSNQALFCKSTIWNILKKREPLFSGWRIKDFIGSGVSGCVFKMERIDLGQTFHAALKVIPLSRKLNRQGRTADSLQNSLGQEAREIIHLYSLGTHQNIVGWYNHDVLHVRTEDSILSLVAVMLEFLPTTLGELLKNGPLPWEQAVKITIDCLKGLEHAHAKNIIHRDLKPGNIFITSDGTAKLGDFGVARKISETTYAETRVGTPLYIAPEVLKDGLGKGYDQLVDIYSIGLVAFEMLSGTLPFEDQCNGNRSCMVNMRISGEPFTFQKTLPPGVAKAVMGAVAYKPSQRYGSATEFRQALEKTLASNGRETFLPKSAQLPERETKQQTGPTTPPVKEVQSSAPDAAATNHHLRDDEFEDEAFHSASQTPETMKTFMGHLEPGPVQNFFSSKTNVALRKPQSILFLALLSCGAAYLSRTNPMAFSWIVLSCYFILPIYLLFITTQQGFLVIVSFVASMGLYNFIYSQNIAGILDNLLFILFCVYLVFFAVFSWIRQRI